MLKTKFCHMRRFETKSRCLFFYCRYAKTETACFRNCAEKLHLVGGELPLLFVLVPWSIMRRL